MIIAVLAVCFAFLWPSISWYVRTPKEDKVLALSSLENIKNYSDRIVVLHKGEIIKEFNVEEYRKKYTDKEINEILFNLVCDGDDDD